MKNNKNILEILKEGDRKLWNSMTKRRREIEEYKERIQNVRDVIASEYYPIPIGTKNEKKRRQAERDRDNTKWLESRIKKLEEEIKEIQEKRKILSVIIEAIKIAEMDEDE